jgi:hypothetical protein
MASGTTGTSGASAATRLSAAGGPPGAAPFSFAKIFSQPLALAAAADIPPLSRKRARRRESSSAGPDSSDSPFARFGPFATETQGGFRVGAEAAVVTPDAPLACSVPGGTPRATFAAASVVSAPAAPSGGRGADGDIFGEGVPVVATVTASAAAPAVIDTQTTTAECADSLAHTLVNSREDEAAPTEVRVSVENKNDVDIAVSAASAASEDGGLSSKASNNRERKRQRRLAREAQPPLQAVVVGDGASVPSNAATSSAAAASTVGVAAEPTFEPAVAELKESSKPQATAQSSEAPASIASPVAAAGDIQRVAIVDAGASAAAALNASAHDNDAEIAALRSENERLRELVRSLRAEELSRLVSENAKLKLEASRLREHGKKF